MKAIEHIQKAIEDTTVTQWQKEALKRGLDKDPIEAWKEAYLVEALLKMRCDEVLKRK